MVSSKIFVLVSVALTVSVSRAFVYNAVDKITTAFLAKDKYSVSLRVISIAYLFGQSLLNILN